MSSDGFDPAGNPPPLGQPGGYSQPGPYGQYARVGRRTNPLAIASLCLGIGQVIAWILTGIPAIVLGFMALKQIRQTGEDGRGMAIAGIVLGFVGIIALALLIIFAVAIYHAASSSGT
jgi:hypothetical protein